MKFTALLPIKSISQRVKNKNFKKLSNKVLFLWILEKLQKITYINEIIINTDNPEKVKKFLKKGKFSKLKLRKRKKSLIGHDVSMNKIILDDIKYSKNNLFLQTHSTNPLLSINFINKSIKLFIKNKNRNDSLFSVDVFQNRFYNQKIKPINHNLQKLKKTQDLSPIYMENSNLYIFSKKSFLKKKNRIGVKPLINISPRMESFDIDNNDDWKLIERLIRK